MVNVEAPGWKSLEGNSSTLFLLAGVLLTGYAMLNGIAAFTDVAFQTVENVVGPAGFALGFVGLLGLYPKLVERKPTSSRVGAGCAALGTVGFATFAVANLGRLVGIAPEDPPLWAGIFLGLSILGMLPGFGAFAIATLGTESLSRTVGYLLLAPPAIFGVMLTSSLLGAVPQWSAFAISGGQALAYLSIGHALRTRNLRLERASSFDDVAAN